MQKGKEFDIAKNVRLVEWLKSEILTSVADLYKMLAGGMKESQEMITDCLASIIVACYLLGRRLGIEFAAVDRKVEGKIRLGIIEEHEVETDFGDLSELGRHIKESRE